MEYLCLHAFHHLLRRHEVLLDHIYFVYTGQLATFKTDGELTRFKLRDSIELQTFEAFAFEWDGSDLCQENRTEFEDDT